MAKMNWNKVRQQTQMARPRTDWTRKPTSKKPFIKPTQKQINYMKVLGIPYKQGMSLGDCSSLIAYTLEHKPDQTSQVLNLTKQVNKEMPTPIGEEQKSV